MRFAIRLFLIATLTVVPAVAQVSTGVPSFSSMSGGSFDQVNLGNLNAHLTIPILHKSGRGTPFKFDLAYDSSIWYPVTVNGATQWQPTADWGWTSQSYALLGYLSTQTTAGYVASTQCGADQVWQVTTTYSYVDPKGTSHPFSGSTLATTCGTTTTYTSLTADASEDLMYQLSASSNPTFTDTVTTLSGQVVAMTSANTASSTYTDSNGNQLTAINSTGQFFDTLSGTVPVLVQTGNGNPGNPIVYSYTAPSGAQASYTVNYTQYTVATNFNLSGINEYGPVSIALVSSIVLPDGTEYTFNYEATPGACTPLANTYASNCVTGRLNEVTLPTGGNIVYSYSGGPTGTGIYSDGSTAGLTRTLSPGGAWTYARTLVSGTPGPGSTWTMTMTDPALNQSVLSFAEDAASGNVATYNMYETQRRVYQGSSSSGTLLKTIFRCYNGNYGSCATALVDSPIGQTDTYVQLPNGTTRLSELVYGNPYGGAYYHYLSDSEYDYGVSLGSSPGTAHLVRMTSTEYINLGNGIDDKPSSTTVDDCSSGSCVAISTTVYSYDGAGVTATAGTPQHIAISGSRGNLTTVTSYKGYNSPGGSPYLIQNFTYYDTGNLNTATDVNGAVTTYNYASGSASCYNSFPTSVSEPLGLSRSTTWNCTGGVQTTTTDENSHTTSIGYVDAEFWRPANIIDQENNETTISYFGQNTVESTLHFGANSVVDARVTVDGFGRTILGQQLQGVSASNYDTTEMDYNTVGLSSRVTMPFSAPAGGTNSSAPGVITSYDALGRPLSKTDADGGTTSYTYTNNDVLITKSGSQSFKKQLEYDGLGRLTSVCEVSTSLSGVGACSQSNAQTGYWTKYTYDALGRLLTVTQNAQALSGQQTRSYTYDMVGRMISETNPETGTVTYTYDSTCGSSYPASAGDMTERVDNAGNTTCYGYDSLHRLTTASNISWSGNVCRNFLYDNSPTPINNWTAPTGVTVANTLGRLKEAYTNECSSPNGAPITDEWYSYSPRGELTDVYELTPHSGTYYHTSAAYYASGSLETLSGIPSVPVLNFGNRGAGLDGEGRYTQVTASSSPNPVTNATYSSTSTSNPLGVLTSVTYGSADSDSFSYDPNTGRLSSYTYSVNGNADTGTLSWNSNGTLGSLVIADSVTGTGDSQTCSYTYDDLRRLGGANCGSTWEQTFGYDAFGNISKSGSSSFLPSYTTANQYASIPGATPTYDLNGNLTNDGLNQYAWDPNWGTLNLVNGVTGIYDANGRLVETDNGLLYTEILWSPVGKVATMNGTTLVQAEIFLPGGGAALYTPGGLVAYRHADWLGSSRLASTQARGLYAGTGYGPFGEPYATSGGNKDAVFTGQDYDLPSSLYNFTFRRYNSSQSRWISPDPAGIAAANPRNPQSWNRYAYVVNNPLANIDVAGLDPSGSDGWDGTGDGNCDNGTFCNGGEGDYTDNLSSGGCMEDGLTMDGQGSCFGDEGGGASSDDTPPPGYTPCGGPSEYCDGQGHVIIIVEAWGNPLNDNIQISGGYVPAIGYIPTISGIPVSGGAGGAPSKPGQETQQNCGAIIATGVVQTGLDALGAIPGEAVASLTAKEALAGSQVLAGFGSTAISVAGGSKIGMGAGATGITLGVASVATDGIKGAAELIPVVGQYVAVGSSLFDVAATVRNYGGCKGWWGGADW